MGHITIQNTSLTAEQVFTVFQSGLSERYEVRRSSLPAIDFLVVKSALVGVGVKLQRKNGEARLRCAPMVPSTLLRMVLLNGLLSSLFLWPVLKRTLEDVEGFASGAPGLNGGTAPLEQRSSAGLDATERTSARPLVLAAWIAVTALLLPTVVGATFGFRALVLNGPIVAQALVAGVIALALARRGSGSAVARPLVLGFVAWYGASMALSVFGFGIGAEISTWFTRYGLTELGALSLSLLVLGRFAGGSAPETAPAPAAS